MPEEPFKKPLKPLEAEVPVIYIGKRIVRIDNTDAYTFAMALKNPKQLAIIAKKKYKTETGLNLNIETSSLESEIFWHAKLYKLGVLKSRTAIADCGEKEVDSNRFFWDIFS